MTDILTKIVKSKKAEVEAAIRKRPLRDLMRQADEAPPTLDFIAPLRDSPPIRLIAEVKKASPSKGVIRQDFDPVAIARNYEKAGASCISVLTDQQFFQGSLDHLSAIRSAVRLPLLRKDFIVHPYQIFEARVAGADAILLIAECLNRQELRGLYQLSRDLSMSVLIELYRPANLDNVLNTGTELIGINNRDLTTFEVDLQHTVKLRRNIPEEKVVVGESGIHHHADALFLQQNNVHAMLVGESLMRQDDVFTAVRQLLGFA
jgi:indole-3-glycerol phosphate synthase